MTKMYRFFVTMAMLAVPATLALSQNLPAPPQPPAAWPSIATMPTMPTIAPMPPMPPMEAIDVWESMPTIAPVAPIPPMPPMPAMAPMPPPALEELALLGEPFEAQDDEARRAQEEQRRAQEEARRAQEEVRRGQEEVRRSMERDNSDYQRGKSYLDRKAYDKAIEAFNRVIENKGSRADGAFYWRAYAQNRVGKRDEALASLSELQKTYPKSRWLDDAKALEAEIRQMSGQPISPDSDLTGWENATKRWPAFPNCRRLIPRAAGWMTPRRSKPRFAR